ncbi:MAG: hypothetical protein FWD72_05255 [Eggerthellaceae bacterium]|nr:hypothetical protein [Eggerthellaceae bacterium]
MILRPRLTGDQLLPASDPAVDGWPDVPGVSEGAMVVVGLWEASFVVGPVKAFGAVEGAGSPDVASPVGSPAAVVPVGAKRPVALPAVLGVGGVGGLGGVGGVGGLGGVGGVAGVVDATPMKDSTAPSPAVVLTLMVSSPSAACTYWLVNVSFPPREEKVKGSPEKTTSPLPSMNWISMVRGKPPFITPVFGSCVGSHQQKCPVVMS